MFTELKLKHLTLNNRIIRSATNEHLATEQGHVSDELIDCYIELARSGVALIFTSHMCVSVGGRGDNRQLMINDDVCVEGLVRLTDAVHKHGSLIVAQLNHAGAKVRANANPPDSMLTSSVDGVDNHMSIDDILHVEKQFAEAAFRAKQAGFDGVQIHMAHGYLLTQFLDPAINRRTDIYGGTPENRFRIAGEIISAVKEKCGEDYPVFVKINCNSTMESEYAFSQYVKWISEAGVEAIEFSGYDFGDFDRNYMIPYYAEKALETKAAVNVPVIIAGGLHDGKTIQETINKGVDAVSLSRALIREPNFAAKLRADRDYVSKCVHCNCCYSCYAVNYKRCVFEKEVNPRLQLNYGRE